MAQDARSRLLDFLDKEAFDPVLRASQGGRSDADKELLKEVKEKTQEEKRRYHEDYGSASEIRKRFMDDLSSEPAKNVHADLHRLDLPALPDIKDEFLSLTDELGVT